MNNNGIRNPDAYLKGIWPDKLFSALPRNIAPTNIDAHYEINDHFLLFERKPVTVVLAPSPGFGQIGAISKLADAAGASCLFAQVTMKGPDQGDEPTSILIHRLHQRPIPTTLEAIDALIQAWAAHADKCRRGTSCLDLSWIPDALRCAAAACVGPTPRPVAVQTAIKAPGDLFSRIK